MTRAGRWAAMTVPWLLGAAVVAAAFIAQRQPAPVVRTVQRVPAPRPAVAAHRAVPAPAPVVAQTTPPAGQTAGEPYRVEHILPIDHAMKFGEWHWDEAGAPATGEVVITVDIQAQVISVFRGGWEIGTAVVLYGAGPTPTPLGIFKITQKDANHHSSIYDSAPMPFMLRLTNDGVSIHGSLVEYGYATHGCVGIPTDFARRLFGVVKLGDRVIVTNGEKLNLGGAITAA